MSLNIDNIKNVLSLFSVKTIFIFSNICIFTVENYYLWCHCGSLSHGDSVWESFQCYNYPQCYLFLNNKWGFVQHIEFTPALAHFFLATLCKCTNYAVSYIPLTNVSPGLKHQLISLDPLHGSPWMCVCDLRIFMSLWFCYQLWSYISYSKVANLF